MPVDQAEPQSVGRQVVRLAKDLRSPLGLVEGTEPGVVVAGHDGELAASPTEGGQGLDAPAALELVPGAAGPRAHPEVAKVADDHQLVVAAEPLDPGVKTVVAFRTIRAEVH